MEELRGSTEPRLSTPPLRTLTPKTSMGFAVIEWAETKLDWHPFPWQRLALERCLEIDEVGNFVHSRCLIIVARQSGKTELLAVLALYWMTHGIKLTLAGSASNETARETWRRMVDIANDHTDVFGVVKDRGRAGAEELELPGFGSRYKVISKNRRGGRGIPAQRVILDELREHTDFEAVSAVLPTLGAQKNSQAFFLSNAGDHESVVLTAYREKALQGTPGWCLLEWSAPEGSEISDPQAWIAANPSLGYEGGKTVESMTADLALPASKFRTEHLSMTVPSMHGAFTPEQWANCLDPLPFSKAQRARVVCGIDISPDGQHIALVAAVKLPDGRVRVSGVAAWQDSQQMRQELPGLLKRVRPAKLAWLPEGAGAIATDLKAIRVNVELSGREVTSACQGLADLVAAQRIAHDGDPLLTEQLVGAKKLQSGEGWKFSRKGGYCDAAYATAAAVHLARSMPAPARLRFHSASAD